MADDPSPIGNAFNLLDPPGSPTECPTECATERGDLTECEDVPTPPLEVQVKAEVMSPGTADDETMDEWEYVKEEPIEEVVKEENIDKTPKGKGKGNAKGKYVGHKKMSEVLSLVLGQLKSNQGVDWQRVYRDLSKKESA
eukprot:s1274_g12.t1